MYRPCQPLFSSKVVKSLIDWWGRMWIGYKKWLRNIPNKLINQYINTSEPQNAIQNVSQQEMSLRYIYLWNYWTLEIIIIRFCRYQTTTRSSGSLFLTGCQKLNGGSGIAYSYTMFVVLFPCHGTPKECHGEWTRMFCPWHSMSKDETNKSITCDYAMSSLKVASLSYLQYGIQISLWGEFP